MGMIQNFKHKGLEDFWTRYEDKTMREMKRCPSHPGEILQELYLKPLKLTMTKLAKILGVSRKHLSGIINGHAGVTPDMALRLGKVFNTTPKMWLDLQLNHDLWIARQHANLDSIPTLCEAAQEQQ